MSYAGYVWECECGFIHYGEDAPEECPKCGRIERFTRLPEELADRGDEEDFEED